MAPVDCDAATKWGDSRFPILMFYLRAVFPSQPHGDLCFVSMSPISPYSLQARASGSRAPGGVSHAHTKHPVVGSAFVSLSLSLDKLQ